jgi:hypothetical protein
MIVLPEDTDILPVPTNMGFDGSENPVRRRSRDPIEKRRKDLPRHTHKFSFINLVYIFRCSSPPHNTVYVRRVDLSTLPFSLS